MRPQGVNRQTRVSPSQEALSRESSLISCSRSSADGSLAALRLGDLGLRALGSEIRVDDRQGLCPVNPDVSVRGHLGRRNATAAFFFLLKRSSLSPGYCQHTGFLVKPKQWSTGIAQAPVAALQSLKERACSGRKSSEPIEPFATSESPSHQAPSLPALRAVRLRRPSFAAH